MKEAGGPSTLPISKIKSFQSRDESIPGKASFPVAYGDSIAIQRINIGSKLKKPNQPKKPDQPDKQDCWIARPDPISLCTSLLIRILTLSEDMG